MNPVPYIRGLFRALLDQPIHDLALRLTLLVLILHGSSNEWLDVPLKILCGFMLLSPSHLRDMLLWTLLTIFVWGINATDWLWIDNHKYLMGYWVLACTLSVTSEDSEKVVVWNARLLIALAFGFATIWKLVGGQYLNGEFLTWTLLFDDRMEVIARLLAQVPSSELERAFALEDALKARPGGGLQASIYLSDRLLFVAKAMSWWTLIVEGIVFIAFLWPREDLLRRIGDITLIFFILATYLIVPVLGFGYLLALLGVTACPPSARRMRAAYLIALIVLQFGKLPWTDWVL